MYNKLILAPRVITIVHQLCEIAGGSCSFERDCMDTALDHLNARPPRLDLALAELEEGVAHVFATYFVEDRYESWLLAAAAELLRCELRKAVNRHHDPPMH